MNHWLFLNMSSDSSSDESEKPNKNSLLDYKIES